MKEQINRLARGEFRYTIPEITVSEQEIIKETVVDNLIRDKFLVCGENEDVKGVVYSSNEKVSVINAFFKGTSSEIMYSVDTCGLTEGEHITGSFDIVSNSKELSIPYDFKVTPMYIDSSMGKIYNLFHFANLVQTEAEEARRIFVSDKFEQVCLKNDIAKQNLYHALLSGKNVDNNIEEFLIAVKKKSRIELTLSDTSKNYESLKENYKDSFVIKKDTWGYITGSVKSDAAFLIITNMNVTQGELNGESFSGNKCEVEYMIDYSKLHAGKNYGRIIIETVYQNLVFEVLVDNSTKDQVIIDAKNVGHEKKTALLKLVNSYLAFRTKKTDLKQWLIDSEHAISRIRGIEDDDLFIKIAYAQIMATRGDIDDARWIMDNIFEDYDKVRENILINCYYLYVNSMIKKDKEYSKQVQETIKKTYENECDAWQILWILMYIDDEYDKNVSLKVARIKHQFHNGCTSPVMYLEACNAFNAQPHLLRVLNEFELQVLLFGLKNDILDEHLIIQLCDIMDDSRNISKKAVKLLLGIYSAYSNDKVLMVLCSILVKNAITGPKVCELYLKGIEKGFKITRLYEAYLDSIDISDMSILPKMVLMYFSYNSTIADYRKAYLYANIISNKCKDMDTYNTYHKNIELFALDQIRKHNIDDNLVAIYNDIWNSSIITKDTAQALSRIMASYKLICNNSSMRYVIVKHKETEEEVVTPIIDNKAYIWQFTDNTSIILVDKFDERHAATSDYSVEKLYDYKEYARQTFEEKNDDLYMMLYFCEQCNSYNKDVTDIIAIENKLINSGRINYTYSRYLNEKIIEYCCQPEMGDDFDEFLNVIDKDNLTVSIASMLIESCILHGEYDKADELINVYGFSHCKSKLIFKLVRRLIENCCEDELTELINMSYFAFYKNKYDDTILSYLVAYYNGTTAEMLSIWRACKGFDVETYELEERIIAQLLFSESYSNSLQEVFKSYYDKGAKDRITSAYLAYNSYNYFVRETVIQSAILELIEERLLYSYDVIDIQKLAVLKYYSECMEQNKTLNEEQQVLGQRIVDEMCSKGMVFKFFEKLKGTFALPMNIIDKTFLEYRTNPDNKVVIHYMVDDEREYRVEDMTNVFLGIFTKDITLFYGDSVQYYITENDEVTEDLTESKSIIYDYVSPDSTDNRFEYINDMLAAKELHDEETLKKLMHGYCVRNFVTEQLFKTY